MMSVSLRKKREFCQPTAFGLKLSQWLHSLLRTLPAQLHEPINQSISFSLSPHPLACQPPALAPHMAVQAPIPLALGGLDSMRQVSALAGAPAR